MKATEKANPRSKSISGVNAFPEQLSGRKILCSQFVFLDQLYYKTIPIQLHQKYISSFNKQHCRVHSTTKKNQNSCTGKWY